MAGMTTPRFTEFDHDVTSQLVNRTGDYWLAVLLVQSYESDQKDAALMFNIQQFRAVLAWLALDRDRYLDHPLPRLLG